MSKPKRSPIDVAFETLEAERKRVADALRDAQHDASNSECSVEDEDADALETFASALNDLAKAARDFDEFVERARPLAYPVNE